MKSKIYDNQLKKTLKITKKNESHWIILFEIIIINSFWNNITSKFKKIINSDKSFYYYNYLKSFYKLKFNIILIRSLVFSTISVLEINFTKYTILILNFGNSLIFKSTLSKQKNTIHFLIKWQNNVTLF